MSGTHNFKPGEGEHLKVKVSSHRLICRPNTTNKNIEDNIWNSYFLCLVERVNYDVTIKTGGTDTEKHVGSNSYIIIYGGRETGIHIVLKRFFDADLFV